MGHRESHSERYEDPKKPTGQPITRPGPTGQERQRQGGRPSGTATSSSSGHDKELLENRFQMEQEQAASADEPAKVRGKPDADEKR